MYQKGKKETTFLSIFFHDSGKRDHSTSDLIVDAATATADGLCPMVYRHSVEVKRNTTCGNENITAFIKREL